MEGMIYYMVQLALVSLPTNHLIFNDYNPNVLKVLEEYDIIRDWSDGYKLTACGQYWASLIVKGEMAYTDDEDEELSNEREEFHGIFNDIVGVWQLP